MQAHGNTVAAHNLNIASVRQELSLIAVYIPRHNHDCIRIRGKLPRLLNVFTIMIDNLCPGHFLHQTLKRRYRIIRMHFTGSMVANVLDVAEHHDPVRCFLVKRKHLPFIFQKHHGLLCSPLSHCYMLITGQNILSIGLWVFSRLIIKDRP